MLFPVEAGLRPHRRVASISNSPGLSSEGGIWAPLNAPVPSIPQCEIVLERDHIRNDPDESRRSLSGLTSGETASPSHLPRSPRWGRPRGRQDGLGRGARTRGEGGAPRPLREAGAAGGCAGRATALPGLGVSPLISPPSPSCTPAPIPPSGAV